MGVSATSNNQTAKTYTGTINSGSTLDVSDNSNNNELASLTFPEEANYIYFSFPTTAFTAKLNDNEISLSEPNQNQNPGNFGPQDNNDPNGLPPDKKGEDNDYNVYIYLSKYIFYNKFDAISKWK